MKAVKNTAGLDTNMPPKEKLSAEQIAALEQWIKLGAPVPASATPFADGPAKRTGKLTAADKQWWAFQPVVKPAVPQPRTAAWARNDIDRFILARLEREGVAPSPEADRVTLIRRVYFDLIGLPPTPADIDAFLADKSADAYEKLVERLLHSPRFGEKWARHWLDLVRYADSDGYKADDYRPHVWRYRDYVVKSFNDDKPYDRFVREQLAGDELFPDNPEAVTGTIYLRNGIYEYNNRDVAGQWQRILEDITDTTADAFLGMGLQCARCHDHKFDPILRKDYYRLQAFFAPLLPREDLTLATATERAEYQAKLAQWEAATAEIRAEIETILAPVRQRTIKVAHKLTGGFKNSLPLHLGGRSGKGGGFDGMLDDVRLSTGALTKEQLLLTAEPLTESTVGFWQFESKPSAFKDASRHGNDIRPSAKPANAMAHAAPESQLAALTDFCHVLLNANEFVYVD